MTPDHSRRPAVGPWWGSITDVASIAVGHAERVGDGWLTGVTVVLPPPGTVGAVDVRGGGPGTHETDALDPTTLVPTVDAVVLTGGSAYGLASATGVQRWCEQNGRGFPVGQAPDGSALVVPIVPAAAVFDLGRGGDHTARPGPDMGYEAASAAGLAASAASAASAGLGQLGATQVLRGSVGAGTGAVMAAGGPGGGLKGGVGTASVRLAGDAVVGALAVVNAYGSPVDAVTGALLGTAFVPAGRPRPPVPLLSEHAAVLHRRAAVPDTRLGTSLPVNTSLVVVATNASLHPAQARRTAMAAHDGIARALRPVHTLLDGDTVFVLATNEVPAEAVTLLDVQAAAADAVLLAVLDAVLAAGATTTPAIDVPGYLDLYPTAVPR